jgi:hypothetical protein
MLNLGGGRWLGGVVFPHQTFGAERGAAGSTRDRRQAGRGTEAALMEETLTAPAREGHRVARHERGAEADGAFERGCFRFRVNL